MTRGLGKAKKANGPNALIHLHNGLGEALPWHKLKRNLQSHLDLLTLGFPATWARFQGAPSEALCFPARLPQIKCSDSDISDEKPARYERNQLLNKALRLI